MNRMEEAIKQLQEAAIVSARFDLRHEQMLKEHAEWLQEHDRAMLEMRRRAEAHDQAIEKMRRDADERAREAAVRGRQLDERIDKLVIAIGETIRRSNGG